MPPTKQPWYRRLLDQWRPKPQTVELGIATEQNEALPVQVVSGSGDLVAGPATVTGVVTTYVSGEANELRKVHSAAANLSRSAELIANAEVTKPDMPPGRRRMTAHWGADPAKNTDTPEPSGIDADGSAESEPDNHNKTSSPGSTAFKGWKTYPEQDARRLNIDQLRRDIRTAFRGDSVVIFQWTRSALDNVALLEAALDGARINDPETVAELRELLADQAEAVENIRRLVKAGATDEAATAYEAALGRWITAWAEYAKKPGVVSVVRGFLAAGAMVWLGPEIAVSWSGTIITATVSGINLQSLKAMFSGKKE